MKKFSLIEKAFSLKNTSLFNDLDLDLLISIAEKMHQEIFDKNENVFDLNQVGNRMYFIAHGCVNILNEKGKIINKLIKLDFFGDESIFNEKPRSYSVICLEDTLLLSFNKISLYMIISECPSVGLALLNIYSKTSEHRYKDEN